MITRAATHPAAFLLQLRRAVMLLHGGPLAIQKTNDSQSVNPSNVCVVRRQNNCFRAIGLRQVHDPNVWRVAGGQN